jgi:hypothetical protein
MELRNHRGGGTSGIAGVAMGLKNIEGAEPVTLHSNVQRTEGSGGNARGATAAIVRSSGPWQRCVKTPPTQRNFTSCVVVAPRDELAVRFAQQEGGSSSAGASRLSERPEQQQHRPAARSDGVHPHNESTPRISCPAAPIIGIGKPNVAAN